jgi:uncharacterized membrane protein YdjX (TVP38/TMEM64 family)
MRLLFLFIGLAAIVLVSFFLLGDSLMNAFTQEGTVTWLTKYGSRAWAAAILLLATDLILPIPATLVMAALGYLYGPLGGGLISAGGSFVSGALGYWLCRLLGEKAALWLLGAHDYARARRMSGTIGGWLVVLSRWLPVFPEVIACIAGLTRMPAGHFHLALACGSIPLGFTYAWVGHTGVAHPLAAIALSAGLPPLIWFAIRKIFRSPFLEEPGHQKSDGALTHMK